MTTLDERIASAEARGHAAIERAAQQHATAQHAEASAAQDVRAAGRAIERSTSADKGEDIERLIRARDVAVVCLANAKKDVKAAALLERSAARDAASALEAIRQAEARACITPLLKAQVEIRRLEAELALCHAESHRLTTEAIGLWPALLSLEGILTMFGSKVGIERRDATFELNPFTRGQGR